MLKCYMNNGNFSEFNPVDFSGISDSVEKNRRVLASMPLGAIIGLLSLAGKAIIKNPKINRVQGISYLSLWLRRKNLEQICRINYGNPGFLNSFADVEDRFQMAARPRGVVCLWVASNVPTLAIISIIQTILSKNGSIVKVPKENREVLIEFLKELAGCKINYENIEYSGTPITDSISVVEFEGKDRKLSSEFSLAADCRLVYGGSAAIRSIMTLPQKDHCETIVYGPKYSFGVFDRGFIESDQFEESLDKTARDIAFFNQMACSSPQVIFFEKSRYTPEEIGRKLGESFEKLPGELLIQPTDTGILANIINVRARYLLSEGKMVFSSDDLSWTVLVDEDGRLEDPVHGKCIFIKVIDSVDEVLVLITRKIQAISVSILDPAKREMFALEATYKGADRIVTPGTIHDYDLPWDGILPLNRLVRWTILKN